MNKSVLALIGASLMLGVSSAAVRADMMGPAPLPPAPTFAAQGKITFVGRDDIETFKALPEYHEPVWVFHRRSIPLKQLHQLRGIERR